MSTITLDPDFPGQVSQPCNMAFVLDSGPTVEIEQGAVWDYAEAGGATQIWLTDCDDRRLIGACIEIEWSQLHARPETLEDRIAAVFMEHTALHDELARVLRNNAA